MTLSTEDKNEVTQYLLGGLSQDAQQRVEKRLMTEEDFFDELLLGEDELIDLYITDDLSHEDRTSFERHFLSTPERHQKLRFARTLSRYISRKSEEALGQPGETQASPAAAVPPTELTWTERFRAFWNNQRWVLQAAVALGVITIIAGVLWLSLPRTPSPQTFATLTLTISATNNRSEGAQASKVKLPLKADALRLSLMLPEGATPAVRYRVELVNENGETKLLEIAGQDAQAVSVVIPAAELARGQYALKLFMTRTDGTEQRVSGSYFFTVE